IVSACNMVSIFRNADFKNERGYSYTKLLAAATEVGQFISYFGHTSKTINKSIPQVPLDTISAVFSIVSTGFSGVVTLMDGWKAVDNKNQQRSLACLGSGIFYFSAFGIQTIQLLSKLKKYAHLKIPKGDLFSFGLVLIAGGIGYWADTLAFDPYQEFLRNCILSKDATKKLKNWKEVHGLEVLQELVEKRNTIVSEEFKLLRDMETSIKEFMSYQSNIFMDPDHTKRSETTTINNRHMRQWTTNYLTINKLTVHCAINEIYFNSELDYSLRIFYFTDNKKETLYYVDVDGKFEETPFGCSITFHRNALRVSVPYATEIVYACFCQRIIYSNGWCQPPEKEVEGSEQKEAVYWVGRVHFDYDYTTQPIYGLFSWGKEDGDPKKLADHTAYQRKENRTYLTLEEVTNIIKKDRKTITDIRSMNQFEYIN
ncbi:MAG: hypothetical protein LUE98_16930, partial [Tannerellaceae bacterium]|nr:hypothetical protein [Tannerellaceae bacterium]